MNCAETSLNFQSKLDCSNLDPFWLALLLWTVGLHGVGRPHDLFTVSDTANFSLSLSGRRDRAFYSFRQLCLYLRKLAKRVVLPTALPAEEDIASILDLDTTTAPALKVTVFLNRTKFGVKLDQACKLKAEIDQHEQKGEKTSIDELKEKAKEEFGRLARSYVTHLFKDTRGHFNFTTNIAQGLASFDLEILLNLPLSLATKCFSQLFTIFRLRGYFSQEQEAPAQEEYLSFVDELRVKFSEFDQPTLLIKDTIDFLMEQTTLPTRPLLLSCFRLACLCIDEPFRSLPTVKFSSVNTEDPTSKLVDIVLPVQSYFNQVANSVESVTSDASISEFLEMESTFGRTALGDTYDPWSGLDNFGRTEILSKLDPDRRLQSKASKAGTSSSVIVQQSPSTLQYSKKNVRPTHLLSDSEVAQSAKSLRQCSSRD